MTNRNTFSQVPTDVASSSAALAALEVECRRRLTVESNTNGDWFMDVARVLAQSESNENAHLQVEILLLIVQWAYKEGRPDDGMLAASRALERAVFVNAKSLQRRALGHLGILHYGKRNLAEATICFAKAFEIAESLGDRAGKCGAIANLAATRLEAGLLDESIKLNRYVIDLSLGEEHLRNLATEAHHNIALASLFIGDLLTASEHMNSALKSLREPNSAFLGLTRVMMEFTFVKILIQKNRLDTARERMQLAVDYANKVNSRPAKRHAELSVALFEAATGQTDIALTRLAAIESEIEFTDPAFRDFLEVELLCNRFAGQEQFARYYRRKHLSSLAQFQRAQANRQIAAIRQSITSRSERDLRSQLEALSVLTELREEPTGEHALRVGRIARGLAGALGYPAAEANRIELAARFHDIGKLAVPDAILSKHNELTPTEMEIMRRHTVEGCQLLVDLIAAGEGNRKLRREDVDVLRMAAQVALHHHECWDGSGYPRRLAAECIPEAARIVAVADAYDELTHARPYRAPLSSRDAIFQIKTSSGKHFDPRLTEVLPGLMKEVLAEPMVHEPTYEGAEPFVLANRVIQRIIGDVSTGAVMFEDIVRR